jgi:hypothetical protein
VACRPQDVDISLPHWTSSPGGKAGRHSLLASSTHPHRTLFFSPVSQATTPFS